MYQSFRLIYDGNINFFKFLKYDIWKDSQDNIDINTFKYINVLSYFNF